MEEESKLKYKNIRLPKILECTCKHEQQDKLYGNKMRVHNACIRNNELHAYRCTKCSKEKNT